MTRWKASLHTLRIQEPYKLSSRTTRPENSVIDIAEGSVRIGGSAVVVMAGPCSVESREQIIEIAHAVKAAGATVLRGGAFKPRTSPYDFQGLGLKGLEYLADARAATGLPIITEVMREEQVPMVAEYADILQIGARNMQNYGLLQAVGKQPKPVMLKRGISGTINELLMCAEYIVSNGNYNVMLCERGIRTYETATRNTFDLNAVPVLKQTEPPAGRGRSVPRHRAARTGAGHEPRRRRRRRRRADPGGPSGPGHRRQRRPPEPDAGRLRDADADLRRVAEAVDRTIAEPAADVGGMA